jgi:mevalonate kinase
VNLDSRMDNLPEDHPFRLAVQAVMERLELSHFPAATFQITSTIPIAAGLGSSAAVSVALVRAAAEFAGVRLAVEDVSALAYRVEQRMHGTPSGIDNTVIAFAQPIYFVRGQPFELLQVGRPLTLIVADTGVQSSTAEAVGGVRQRWQQEPERYEQLFDEIGAISQAARTALRQGQVAELGRLMNENQRRLEAIGVSSPELERLNGAALAAGALGAKLSGGGGGGNMIALCDPEQVVAVVAALHAAGAVRSLINRLPATAG